MKPIIARARIGLVAAMAAALLITSLAATQPAAPPAFTFNRIQEDIYHAVGTGALTVGCKRRRCGATDRSTWALDQLPGDHATGHSCERGAASPRTHRRTRAMNVVRVGRAYTVYFWDPIFCHLDVPVLIDYCGDCSMTLKVTTPMRGSVDGISLDQFEVGRVYEVCTELGCYLLAMGSAVPADDQVPESVRLPAEKRLFGPKPGGWSTFRRGLAAHRTPSDKPDPPAAPRKRSRR